MALPANLAAFRGGGKYNDGGSIIAFNPEPFIHVVLEGLEERMDAAGELFVEAAKANFVFQYPPHSMPWDFPHHGEKFAMRDAINHTVFRAGYDIVLQMGIIDDNLPGRLNLYPAYLETGTRFMSPRPWLTITLDETWGELAGLITGMGTL